MLTAYITQTRSLLQLPGTQSTSLYSDADLTRWINIARGQLAGEAECIRVVGTISAVIGQQPYTFAGINLGVPATTGVQGAINVNSMSYSVASGQLWINPRPWPWFTLYELNNAAPQAGPPRSWSQFGQGAAPGNTGSGNGGTFYISPAPDYAYQLNCNCVCYPNALAVDGDVEAIPYLWTDAVPFFAAYFALMSAQTNARMADAAQMYKNHYKEFMDRARGAANPSQIRWIYRQAPDPVQAAKLGVKGGMSG